ETRDMHREMMRLTLEIVVRCLFSADVSDDVDEVGATLGELVKPFASQATLKWILNNRLPTPSHIRFHRLARKIDNVVYRIIAERRASGKDEGDLLSMLLDAQDEDGSGMDDRQLRDEVMTLFLAGHASSISHLNSSRNVGLQSSKRDFPSTRTSLSAPARAFASARRSQ